MDQASRDYLCGLFDQLTPEEQREALECVVEHCARSGVAARVRSTWSANNPPPPVVQRVSWECDCGISHVCEFLPDQDGGHAPEWESACQKCGVGIRQDGSGKILPGVGASGLRSIQIERRYRPNVPTTTLTIEPTVLLVHPDYTDAARQLLAKK